jgi:hypothetical protein
VTDDQLAEHQDAYFRGILNGEANAILGGLERLRREVARMGLLADTKAGKARARRAERTMNEASSRVALVISLSDDEWRARRRKGRTS